MKKIVSAADLGGAPIYKSDMREIFNDEIWDAIEALLSPFQSDTQGIIVSGCVFTNNAGNFDMTAGIVYLNGEFMRIAAVTNQTFTKYIAASTPTQESRTFADGTVNDVTESKTAGLVGSAPMSGQYITISSLTDADSRRWRPISSESPSPIRTKVFEIGDWDMDTFPAKLVALPGIDQTKIRGVNIIIIHDNGTTVYQFDGLNAITGTGIFITRDSSSVFDSTNFDSTSYNRGWVTITYAT